MRNLKLVVVLPIYCLVWGEVLLFSAPQVASAGTIAITEFIVNPWGADETAPEYYELFNYGATTVNVNGWTLRDNSSATYTLPDFEIPSGGYAVIARNRANFLTKWLGGNDDARVLPTSNSFVINNTPPGDGLILRNGSLAEGDIVWSLGYVVDDDNPNSPYRATWLTIDDFTVTDYGQPPQLGTALINRNGLDGTGTLGYEDNNFTPDPFMYASAARNDDGNPVEYGSPLLGGYTAVPEPSSIALLLAGAGLLAMVLRKGRLGRQAA